MSERFIIELVAGGLVFLGSLALTQVFQFSPLLSSMKHSGPFMQAIVFASLPMTIYGISRLYFTGVLMGMEAAMGILPEKAKNSATIWRLLAFVAMYVGVQVTKLAFPGLADTASDMWSNAVGQLPDMVMDHTKTERAKFFERGQKFFWLIAAWFAFFFVFELILRGIVLGISKILKATVYKNSSRQEEEIPSDKVVYADDEPNIVNEASDSDNEDTAEEKKD